ncbi:hypothetical protein GCM10009118_00090 [Wandonia haliotis]|uniref:HTH araC/xylS-type domain-containing protein n=2 Tax=Wandonia haliotis TaxID=574963 RepID=A0ABN1MKU8_9FLAO
MNADLFKWQSTPLQIYPLEKISDYLVLPTPLLRTDYNFIIYLYKGSYYQQVGVEKYTVDRPSILYVTEGDVFALLSKKSNLSGFFILMENKVLSSVLGKIELADLLNIETLTLLNHNTNLWFNNLCQLLYKEVSASTPNRKVGSGLLQALLHKLIEINDGKKTITRQHEVANHFKQLLNKSYKEHKSVTYYAQVLNVSENYLNRCVNKHFQKSCKQLIQETIIINSQILMFESNMDIREISFEVGFDDPSYFSRVFKKITGQTPSTFKKNITHDLS